MKTSFDKRIRLARWLLLIALGVYIGGQFLPWSPYSSPEPLGVLWGMIWECLLDLTKEKFDGQQVLFSVIYGGAGGVTLAAPFLVRPLVQRRVRLWVLRVLMGVVTGLFSWLVIALYVRPSEHLSPGGLVPMLALWFEMAGLFVIPQRKKTELLESDPPTAITE